ncbi:GNAT family N-acetyltransferase [Oryzisolibacter sp. LB2S]|uniref:GNAT family N-acetyltransferase n=1 Tax=Alicycliphilus soli TaxID=3228789 RepID=UPI003459045D
MNQKLSFLLGPGGGTAALFFGFKSLTGAEVFRFAAKTLVPGVVPALPPDWRYVELRTPADVAALEPGVRAQLGAQSGAGPEQLVRRGASLHALLCGDAVVAQLNIETSPACEVDDPKLTLHLAEGDSFLGFLHTWPEFRRRGAAQLLIAATEQVLRERGLKRLVTHVRATNVPSMAAFKNLGYRFNALVFSKTSGMLLGALGMRRLGLQALPVRQGGR